MKLCSVCEFIYEDDQRFCDMDGAELSDATGMFAFNESRSESSEDTRPFPLSETLPALPLSETVSAPVSLTTSPLLPVTPSPFLPVSPSLFQRFLRSQFSLAALALFGVISSALVIGYYDAVSEGGSSGGTRDAAVSLVPSAHAESTDTAQPETKTDEDSDAGVEPGRTEVSITLIKDPEASVEGRAEFDEPTTSASSDGLSARQSLKTSSDVYSRAESVPVSAERVPTRSQRAHSHSKKESKVSSVLKKTRRILTKPFRF